MIQVSPPDKYGFCSYGVSTDVVKSAAESASKVIAKINPQMPRALGDRFISMLKSMPHRKLQQFCCIDYDSEMSFVAHTKDGVKQNIVGLGSYHLNPATHRAEIAFMMADAWQGKGIGTYMMQALVKIAKSKKIKGFTAEVMRDNVAMIALMQKAGVEPKSTIVNGSYLFTMDF
ncbi:MAG: hypothetical protein A3K60_04200 [Euryarchaeota archaeon RBG_19FT_COMBO_56_21]|nr:MAG: hypothetical protein A3K60_04200 [Euryarchaeota archaeon RBG_19FT_COMBO_56_21]